MSSSLVAHHVTGQFCTATVYTVSTVVYYDTKGSLSELSIKFMILSQTTILSVITASALFPEFIAYCMAAG